MLNTPKLVKYRINTQIFSPSLLSVIAIQSNMRKLVLLTLLLLLHVHSTQLIPAPSHAFLQVSQSDSPLPDQDDLSNSAYPSLQFPSALPTDSDDSDDRFILVPRSQVAT